MAPRQSQRQQPRIPDQVLNIVQYLLTADQNKTPIKRADIVKNAIPNQAKSFSLFMEQARSCLEVAYGIKVLEVPKNNSYILVSLHSRVTDWSRIPDLRIHYDSEPGLLILILAFIYMSGGNVKEDYLWKFLAKLKLERETKISRVNEKLTLKQMITTKWVRQLYLATEVIDRESKELSFNWGFRADHEINKMDMLKWVCKILGDDSEPSTWRVQFQFARDHEKEFQRDIQSIEVSQRIS
ncbi:non-structural maintenance of chromosomes element 3 homolog [Brevipalpus obovatus]|uniref:non-structural maintenance of chromosomes element 3 homolog n=1 Tax=Brevipalpus obovatus TaxID=246614 RepID=UPI003D9E467C